MREEENAVIARVVNQRRSLVYRGSVEAPIPVVAGDVAGHRSGARARLLQRVLSSRPSADSLIWPLRV